MVLLAIVIVLFVPPGEGSRGGHALPARDHGGHAVRVWPTDPVALGRMMAAQVGWEGEQWDCLFQVVEHESGWKVTAWNRQSGASDPASDPYGAYGLPQSHPPSKLASAGPDWRTSARTQLLWLFGYIRARRWESVAASLQGTPCGAWAHWRVYLSGHASYSY